MTDYETFERFQPNPVHFIIHLCRCSKEVKLTFIIAGITRKFRRPFGQAQIGVRPVISSKYYEVLSEIRQRKSLVLKQPFINATVHTGMRQTPFSSCLLCLLGYGLMFVFHSAVVYFFFSFSFFFVLCEFLWKNDKSFKVPNSINQDCFRLVLFCFVFIFFSCRFVWLPQMMLIMFESKVTHWTKALLPTTINPSPLWSARANDQKW